MRLMRIFGVVIMFTTGLMIGSGAGVSSSDGAFTRFFLAIGDYYGIPQREVMMIRERGIPVYEIPVVLFIAKRAHAAPEIITDFRLRDNTWLSTTFHFGLGAEIFYVPMGVVVRDSFYSKAYGYYKHKPKKEWKTIPLNDDDIINLVNLKLISEHYGYPPEKVIQMRSEGREFAAINDEIRKERKD